MFTHTSNFIKLALLALALSGCDVPRDRDPYAGGYYPLPYSGVTPAGTNTYYVIPWGGGWTSVIGPDGGSSLIIEF